jgi:ABC-2 type transport system ATP-binding protein
MAMQTHSTLRIPVAQPEPAIALTDLVVRCGSRRAVDGLSLSVPRGAVFGFLGANGAGKTTTIKALLGFHPPTSGDIRVLGYEGGRQQIAINARIGYVSETNTLYRHLNALELCAFFRATARRWDQPLVERYLRLFDLPTRRPVRHLSKGMRTQLALCLALGSAPELLILDEPTTGLDPLARRAFLNMVIGEVAAAGTTVFFSSHVLADVEAADSVGVLRAGKLVLSGDVDSLRQRHAEVRLAYSESPSEALLDALRRVPGVIHLDCEGRGVRVRLTGDVPLVVAALRAAGSQPVAVETSYLSLEAIFLYAMQEGRS